jgi:hypothetical protein
MLSTLMHNVSDERAEILHSNGANRPRADRSLLGLVDRNRQDGYSTGATMQSLVYLTPVILGRGFGREIQAAQDGASARIARARRRRLSYRFRNPIT